MPTRTVNGQDQHFSIVFSFPFTEWYTRVILRNTSTSNNDNQERSFVTHGGLKIVTASSHVENCHLCLAKQCELPISTTPIPYIYTLRSTLSLLNKF